MAPFFSILIASYNRPAFIRKCIYSILANNFDDYEIIISDDCSPRMDEIETIFRKEFSGYPNIQFFRQETNLGQPENQNFLVSRANGKYYIALGDDDLLYKNSLSGLYSYIQKYPGYDLYAFGYSVIDENDRHCYSRYSPIFLEMNIESKYLNDFLCADVFPFWFFHPSVFCCLTDIRDNVKYKSNVGTGEDYLFLYDLLNLGKTILILPKVLFMWRRIYKTRTDLQVNLSLDNYNNLKAIKDIYYYMSNRHDLTPRIEELVRSTYFRRRFLYNSFLSIKSLDNSLIDRLINKTNHLREFNEYKNKLNIRIIRYFLFMSRIKQFIKIVGISGVIVLLKTYSQKLLYFIKSNGVFPK